MIPIRVSRLLMCACLSLPQLVVGQTTPLERRAAGGLLRQIETFQQRMAPTDLGRALAGESDAGRDAVLSRVETLWNAEMQDLSDHIGRNPEIGFEEYQAVDTLTAVLRSHGFTVEIGQADLATAFVGARTSSAGAGGPALGIILEYDALTPTSAF